MDDKKLNDVGFSHITQDDCFIRWLPLKFVFDYLENLTVK